MMMQIQKCPDPLPEVLDTALRQIAKAWVASELRPRPNESTIRQWDQLIGAWLADPQLPLFIRKHKDNRGSLIPHSTGRMLVPTDNSPAHWAMSLALAGECPTLEDVRRLIASKMLPVAMMLKAVEKNIHNFQETQLQSPANKAGWKICHTQHIGLKTRTPLREMPITVLQNHFRKFISPSNMFVVPVKLQGLGELHHMLEEIRSFDKHRSKGQ